MNLECTLHRVWAKLPRLLGLKAFCGTAISKGFSPFQGFFLKRVFVHVCCCLFRSSWWDVFDTALISSFHLLSLLFWTCARLSGWCPVCVCVCICVHHCYASPAFTAPCPQICAAHFDWHGTAMRLECSHSAYVLAVIVIFKIFETLTEHHILETWKRYILNVSP